ncbi:MAG: hypothetical protein Q4G35_09195 [Propionibacteriaceae bacterium]|nr:hypothetical protein [Propionibacteriaceae bacterium]
MTENQISDALKHIVADEHSGTDWMKGTRTKRNRRRAITGGVTVVALAAVGVPLALSLQGRGAEPIVAVPPTVSPSATATEAPTTAPSVEPSEAGVCGATAPVTVLPGGAPGVLCAYNADPEGPRVAVPLSSELVKQMAQSIVESAEADEFGGQPVKALEETPSLILSMDAAQPPVSMFAAEVGTVQGYAWQDGDVLRGWTLTIPATEGLQTALEGTDTTLVPAAGGWSPCINANVDFYTLVEPGDIVDVHWCQTDGNRVVNDSVVDLTLAADEIARMSTDGTDVDPVPQLGGGYLAVEGPDGVVNRYHLTADGKLAFAAADGTATVWTPSEAFAEAIDLATGP